MSYDEQPDGDIHGECALEIKTLNERISKLEGSVNTLESECNQLNDMTIKQRLLIDDLASMCRRLSYSVKRSGNDKLAHQCVELLKKYDLGGSVLRTHENSGRQSAIIGNGGDSSSDAKPPEANK